MTGAGLSDSMGRYTSAASSTPSRIGIPTSKTGLGSSVAFNNGSSKKRWKVVFVVLLSITDLQ